MKIVFHFVIYYNAIGSCSASTDFVGTAVDASMGHCIKIIQGYISSLKYSHLCSKTSLYRCTLHQSSSAHNQMDFNKFCGVLNSGMHLESTTWRIRAFETLGLFIRFYKFNLPSSMNCENATLNIWSQGKVTLCGKLLPSSISLFNNTAYLECISAHAYQGFFFVLFYEAVDISSSLIAGHIDHFCRLDNQVTSILSFGNVYSALQYNTRDYCLKTDMLARICLSGITAELGNIYIYDGAGPLSPIT